MHSMGKNNIYSENKGRKKAKWSKTMEGYKVRYEITIK